MDRKKQRKLPKRKAADDDRKAEAEIEGEGESGAEPLFVNVRDAVPIGDTVIVYEGAHFAPDLVVDPGSGFIVADIDVKSEEHERRFRQRISEDASQVEGGDRNLPQQLIQQQQQQQQLHVQHQLQSQVAPEEYEIVHYVQANPTIIENHDSDVVTESRACWLNTKYEQVVKKLQFDYDAGVKLLHSSKGVFKCLYFTTPSMQQAFNAVPQFLCIETDLSFRSAVVGQSEQVKQTVCLMLAEDGNGKSTIVSVGISTVGDNIRWLLETFKSCNPAWRQVRCVIADPGHNTEAIKSCFSGAHVCCNTWQVARWMGKYTIPPTSIQSIRDYIDSILKGEELEDSKLRRLFGGTTLAKLARLLDKENLTNYIHNGLEKVLQRFEILEITPGLQPEEFVTFFFDVVKSMEEDRKSVAINRLQETINLKLSPTDTLTQYAYFLIHQQTLLAQQNIDRQQNGKECNDYVGTYATSTQECLCPFGRVFRLPCRHILMLTSELKVKSHIPFELRWTVFHCLFGCEMDTSTLSTCEKQVIGDEQAAESEHIDQHNIKQEYLMSQRQGQVIYCTSANENFSTTSDTVQFIKTEPNTQTA